MITDNLASLFAPNPQGAAMPASFRVGLLTNFNPNDGSNTVVIGTSILPDLPLLVTGAEIGLEDNDNVLLMYLGNSVMIIGKITTPGSASYGASAGGASRDSSLDTGPSGGFGLTGGFVTNNVANGQSIAPGWAHSALVWISGQASLHNNSAGVDNLESQVTVSNPNGRQILGGSMPVAVETTRIGTTTALANGRFSVIPNQPVDFAFNVLSGNNWPTDGGAIAGMWWALEYFREDF